MTDPRQDSTATELLSIYEQLRHEIMEHHAWELTATGAMLALAASGIAGVAFAPVPPSPQMRIAGALVITVLTCWTILLLADRKRGTVLVAGYLRVAIEPRLQAVRWETDLDRLRRQWKFNEPRGGVDYFCRQILWTIACSVAGLALHIARTSLDVQGQIVTLIAFAAVLSYALAVTRRMLALRRRHDKVDQLWRETLNATDP